MRILYLTDEPRQPLITGNRLRNWNLVSRLAARHAIEWWCLLEEGGPEGGPAPDGVVSQDVRMPPGWESRFGRWRKWLRVPFSRTPLLMVRPPYPPLSRAIAGAARGADVVHCSTLSTWSMLPAGLAPRCVADLQDSMSLRYDAFLENNPAMAERDRSFLWYRSLGQRDKLLRYERGIPDVAGAAVMVAERDRARLGNPRMHVIPNGVDCGYYRRAAGPRVPGRIVFFGNLRYRPNAEAAAWLAGELLPRVRERLPAAHLHLVGAQAPPAVEGLAALPGVTVVGWVADLREELSAAEVFACPLRVASGMQNKVLEALAMDLPTVSTPAGANGLELTAGEHLVVAPAGPGFADALADLLHDATRRGTLARQGRLRVEQRYSWEGAARAFEALYEEIAARARNGSRA